MATLPNPSSQLEPFGVGSEGRKENARGDDVDEQNGLFLGRAVGGGTGRVKPSLFRIGEP